MTKFVKFLRYDLKNGILSAWKHYLLALVFFLCIGVDFLYRCAVFQPKQNFTLGDFAAYVFAGMRKYVPSIYDSFRFPALWVLLFALILYGTLRYTDEDMRGFGQHTMLHSASRNAWWFSKCAWNALSVLTFFLLLWVVMLLFALCGDLQFSFEISPYIDLFLDAGEVRIPSVEWSLTLELFILPPMVAIALSMVQMTLSLFMKPVFSYICSLVYLLASAYYTSPALLGNYAMVLRSEQVMENGVSPTVGVLYATVLTVLSAALGHMLFRRHNILGKEET